MNLRLPQTKYLLFKYNTFMLIDTSQSDHIRYQQTYLQERISYLTLLRNKINFLQLEILVSLKMYRENT